MRWVPLATFLAAVEEDMLACDTACARGHPHQQESPLVEATAAGWSPGMSVSSNGYGSAHGGGAPRHAFSSAAATAAPPKHCQQQQQRIPGGGRTSARLAGIGGGFGGVGLHSDSLADAFGAYDACVEAARVEPAVFAFAAWRQQQQEQQQHNKCLRPGQWVEVMTSKKEDKRFFYSAIGVVQQVGNEPAEMAPTGPPGSLLCAAYVP